MRNTYSATEHIQYENPNPVYDLAQFQTAAAA